MAEALTAEALTVTTEFDVKPTSWNVELVVLLVPQTTDGAIGYHDRMLYTDHHHSSTSHLTHSAQYSHCLELLALTDHRMTAD